MFSSHQYVLGTGINWEHQKKMNARQRSTHSQLQTILQRSNPKPSLIGPSPHLAWSEKSVHWISNLIGLSNCKKNLLQTTLKCTVVHTLSKNKNFDVTWGHTRMSACSLWVVGGCFEDGKGEEGLLVMFRVCLHLYEVQLEVRGYWGFFFSSIRKKIWVRIVISLQGSYEIFQSELMHCLVDSGSNTNHRMNPMLNKRKYWIKVKDAAEKHIIYTQPVL